MQGYGVGTSAAALVAREQPRAPPHLREGSTRSGLQPPCRERGMPLEDQFRSLSDLNVEPDTSSRHRSVQPLPDRGDERDRGRVDHVLAPVRPSHGQPRGQADAASRRAEQMQQKADNWLLPGRRPVETTIVYEQVAVDLTAWLARMEPDPYLKQNYDFGLLEDFDHLYRYANLLDLMKGKKAESITGTVTEIMPGRPDPMSSVTRTTTCAGTTRSTRSRCLAPARDDVGGRRAADDELLHERREPPRRSGRARSVPRDRHDRGAARHPVRVAARPARDLVRAVALHEYLEVLLYHSFMEQETDPRVKAIWELHLNMEIGS